MGPNERQTEEEALLPQHGLGWEYCGHTPLTAVRESIFACACVSCVASPEACGDGFGGNDGYQSSSNKPAAAKIFVARTKTELRHLQRVQLLD
jgi:hypothetical protein